VKERPDGHSRRRPEVVALMLAVMRWDVDANYAVPPDAAKGRGARGVPLPAREPAQNGPDDGNGQGRFAVTNFFAGRAAPQALADPPERVPSSPLALPRPPEHHPGVNRRDPDCWVRETPWRASAYPPPKSERR
jgi:hypothetical protein